MQVTKLNAHKSPQLERTRAEEKSPQGRNRPERPAVSRLGRGLQGVKDRMRMTIRLTSFKPSQEVWAFVRPWLAMTAMPQAAFTPLIRSRSSQPAQRWSESTASHPGRFESQPEEEGWLRDGTATVTSDKLLQTRNVYKNCGEYQILHNVALTLKYTVCFIVQITILILVQCFGCIY